MFGIGVKKQIDSLWEQLTWLLKKLDTETGRVKELESAVCLFARKCGQCKQWKRKDVKGWYKGPEMVLSSWTGIMFIDTSGNIRKTSPLAGYICPECMKGLKPADDNEETS